MDVFSVTEARKKLGELISRVKYQKCTIAIGKNGKADVIMFAFPADDEIPITDMCNQSESFDFLGEEPDLYSINDLKKQYV